MWTLFLSQTLNFSVGTSSSSVSCDSTSSHLLFERFLFLSQVLVTADLDFGVKRLQSKKDTASLRSAFSERGDIQKKTYKRMKLNTHISTSPSRCNLAENEDGNFLLPDLNLMPCEEAALYMI
ncbi:hypothetical protein Bca52824_094727 [Brassica carinata]|uniref:Uncharacterized protein n=1 Tax=Brassica carinata TaxID=52824 RepID=A0A8X7TIV2_BRACI|nr:hypothetical protein Bca52824_094727 [Brassica carinata]